MSNTPICMTEANREGRSMAIMPGEPADMVRKDYLTFYRKLGRDRFLDVLRFYPHSTDKELKEHYRNLVAEAEDSKKGNEPKELRIFNE